MKVMWIHQKMLGSALQMRRKLCKQRFHGKKLALQHLVTPPAIDLSQNQALKAAQGELDLIKNYPRKGQLFFQVFEMYIRDRRCYFLPFHFFQFFPKIEEWKEIAILKLLFPSTPFISNWKEIAVKMEGNNNFQN